MSKKTTIMAPETVKMMAKSSSITLRNGGQMLLLQAFRKDNGHAVTTVTTKDAKGAKPSLRAIDLPRRSGE